MNNLGWEYWHDLWQGLRGAIALLFTGDPETWAVIRQSVTISGTATVLSVAIGLPMGSLLALARFRGRSLLLAACNTGFGLPPVVVGLVISILLLRHGPLGALQLQYTPAAMVLAQVVLALPVVIGLSAAALQQLPPRLTIQLRALGASRWQTCWLLWREARLPLLATAMAAFGSVVSEVGASQMVGGNLPGTTRVLTTAIVMEAGMGHYDRALAYGLILLLLVAAVVGLLTWAQQRGSRE
jgi:tungstate transport system permease protein